MKLSAIYFFVFAIFKLSASTDDEFRVKANKRLPLIESYYSYVAVWGAFSDNIKNPEDFSYGLKMLFNKLPEQTDERLCFPKPAHGAKIVNAGWQCLLSKILKAQADTDDAEKLQKNALLTLLALHKNTLKAIAPGLGDRAKKLLADVDSAVPCSRCLGTAKADYVTA